MPPQSSSLPESDAYDDIHESMFSKRGCCFIFPCMGSAHPSAAGGGGSVWWQRIRAVDKCEADERWWVRGWRKLREWSELLAGPKWKTFIRRLGRNPNCCWGGAVVTRHDHGRFQYDPLSYSLNFDDGEAHSGRFVDDSFVCRDFSSRHAPLPVSTKSSMDLTGNENGAHLFG